MCIFYVFSFKYSCKSLILFKAFFLFVVTKFRRVSQKKLINEEKSDEKYTQFIKTFVVTKNRKILGH